jgi:hypothetical protein
MIQLEFSPRREMCFRALQALDFDVLLKGTSSAWVAMRLSSILPNKAIRALEELPNKEFLAN